ncbi:MAG: formyltransferase [Deltaproteobacteria bacterium]|nr:formyltransferase [Deltaproteobacteria bacterium]
MRAVVFGYHNLGHDCLEVLIESGVDVAALITHEDDPKEEIYFRTPFSLARGHDIPVRTPTASELSTPWFVNWIRSLSPEILFSFYYRHMIPEALLAIPTRGAMNMHGSLLPKYRGRCPVNWVIINGEEETGVTLHYMVGAPDAGDIVGQERVAIADDDTAGTLMEKINGAGVALFRRLLPAILEGTAPRIPQDESRASYFSGRRPGDGRIDWKQPAAKIHNLVRAVTHPYPGAFTESGGKKLFVWESRVEEGGTGEPGEILSTTPLTVAAGSGALALLEVQREGEEEMEGTIFAKRHGLKEGNRL